MIVYLISSTESDDSKCTHLIQCFLCADSESNPQTLLFSATCPPWVYVVAKKYMRPTYEHVDLIGKKTQKAATTVEVTKKTYVMLSTSDVLF